MYLVMDTMENDIEINKAKDEKKERKKAKQMLTEREREEIKNDIKEYIVHWLMKWIFGIFLTLVLIVCGVLSTFIALDIKNRDVQIENTILKMQSQQHCGHNNNEYEKTHLTTFQFQEKAGARGN